MQEIKINAWIGEDKKLILDLPPETPTGAVAVHIVSQKSTEASSDVGQGEQQIATSRREQVRKKMLEAGILSTAHHAPPGWTPLTEEDRMHLGTLPPGAQPTHKYIDEDRGEL